MLARITDRFVLRPSTHSIPADGKVRRVVKYDGGTFEAWLQRANCDDQQEPKLFILKFPGTGGRAERATIHPADAWLDLPTEIWGINPPGYGTSGGRASLRTTASVASAAFNEICRASNGLPIIVTGNSLGGMAAIYVAANHRIDGLLLRNPPPLRQLIAGHYGRWNLGASRFIARYVPDELCTIENASRTTTPAVFIMSGNDRTVPPHYQRKIIDAYQGPQQTLLLQDADHASPIDDEYLSDYAEKLNWLREQSIDTTR